MFDTELVENLGILYKTTTDRGVKFVTLDHIILTALKGKFVVDFFAMYRIDLIEVVESIETHIAGIEEFYDTDNRVSSRTNKEVELLITKCNYIKASFRLVEISSLLLLYGALLESSSGFSKSLLLFRHTDIIAALSAYIKTFGGRDLITSEYHPLNEDHLFLSKYCVNLTKLAYEKKLDVLTGRDTELKQLIEILGRRKKNGCIVLGEAGIGKTALIEGLAQKIVDGDVPARLLRKEIYSLNCTALIAGTTYRGDSEKRFIELMKAIKDKGNVILFIDEIHCIAGLGNASDSNNDFSNFLKPELAAGSFMCIGATTYKEYAATIEKNNALNRRFSKLLLDEPDMAVIRSILETHVKALEEHHKVVYSDKAIDASISLTDHYIKDRKLPDKAIDLLDQAGSAIALNQKQINTVITKAIVEQILIKNLGLPPHTLSVSKKGRILKLEKSLQSRIFGQNEAIEVVSNHMKLSSTGLVSKDKPICSLLFSGPTGVGKTELAKQLSSFFNLKLHRLDMSEYSDAHSISKLIGTVPGFVGYEDTSSLTDYVRKNPHSVILFDEIEKAHPIVHNLLLQIMDYGFITSGSNQKVDFRNTYIILTSNIGSSELDIRNIGFLDVDNKTDRFEAVKKAFSPEFRNRLDAVVQFNKLTITEMKSIVVKFIQDVKDKLSEKDININVTDEAIEWLSINGFDKSLGARPLARVIQTHISLPVANLLLGNKVKRKGTIKVSRKDNKLEVLS